MSMNSLEDVYLDQIKGLYRACKQSLEVTHELARAAMNDDLK